MELSNVLYDVLDSMANPVFWVPTGRRQKKTVPMMSLSEDKENVYAKFIIPGVSREAVQVTVENNILRVSGKKDKPEIGGKTRCQDRWYGEFSRDVGLSPEVDVDNVVAKYEDGILVVTLAKAIAKAKQIEIN